MTRYHLGLDCSTQSLTAVIVDAARGAIVHRASVNFDADLPRHGTRQGVLREDDSTVVHAPPLMWVEALELLLARMKSDGAPFAEVGAVSGSGQQHGSVYLNGSAASTLAALDPARSLAKQLGGIFSRATAPVWMDSSTSRECEEIARALGGQDVVVESTGSAACERFTGPQIRKFRKTSPAEYEATTRIALVSSFMASVLAGRIAPIDSGDGAGMNLMDIRALQWNDAALDATAPDLARRLPPIVPPTTIVGPISRWFAERFGFRDDARVVAWTGDNPSSAVGLSLIEPGMAAVSLGTSDTYFGTMSACRTDPRGEGHVFPMPAGGYMSLLCFKNGSLARERIRDAHGLDWNGFSAALASIPPGNNGAIMLPYFEPEIVPKVFHAGVRRFGLSEGDAAANCRAVVEAQMISMRIHSAWMGVRPTSIRATGGASVNREILQVMADVLRCPVHRCAVTDGAALGAALRAAHADLAADGSAPSWRNLVAPFVHPASDHRVDPRAETGNVYDDMAARYATIERESATDPASDSISAR